MGAVWLPVLVVTFLLKSLVTLRKSQLGQQAAAQARISIRKEILQRADNLGVNGLGMSTSQLSIFYIEQVDQLTHYISRFYGQALTSRIQPLLVIIAVFAVNWVAGLILLITSPLLPIFMILIGLKTAEMNAKQLKSLLYLGNQFHDKLTGIKTIIMFNRQEYTLSSIARHSQAYTDTTMNLLKVAFLNSAVLEFLSSICIALMAIYYGISYLEQSHTGSYSTVLTLVSGYFCLTLAGEFFQPFRDLGTFYHDRSAALNAIDELERFINQQAQENLEFQDKTQVERADEEKDNLYNSSFKTIDVATNPESTRIYRKNASPTGVENNQGEVLEEELSEKEEKHSPSSAQVDLKSNATSKPSKKSKSRIKSKTTPKYLDASQAPQLHNLCYAFSKSSSAKKPLLLTPDSLVSLKDVSVYSHSGKKLLQGINLEFSLRDKIAIIGMSGAGKTTIVNLLLGLVPYAGSVTIDGIELTDINRDDYYAYFSWLGQNPNLQQKSLLANLEYRGILLQNQLNSPAQLIPVEVQETGANHGVENNSADQLAKSELAKHFQELLSTKALSNYSIEQAANIANLKQIIATHGWEFEMQQQNIGLSGGQVQRIAFARMLAKPHLFAFVDEPTANLDAELEEELFANLASHPQGILMVTHRLKHAQAFARVFALYHGKLIELDKNKDIDLELTVINNNSKNNQASDSSTFNSPANKSTSTSN